MITSSNVAALSSVSHQNGDVTVKMTAETGLMNSVAVSDNSCSYDILFYHLTLSMP